MAKRFDGMVALVTGAARGIGAATCRRLGDEGATVFACDVLDEEGEAMVRDMTAGERDAFYLHLDVAVQSQWQAVVQQVAARAGRLDVLVNNAGIARLEDIEQETVEGFAHVIAVNETGVWLGMKSAMAMLKQSGGSIVNVASILGTVGGNGTAIAYQASKGAVRLMTKNAAIRYAKEGVRVNSVHPGYIETPMVAPFLSGETEVATQMRAYVEATTPMGRLGRSEEVAAAIAFLASRDATYVTGSELYVDGGWTAW